MNELSLEEFKRLKQQELLKKEEERLMMNIEHTVKNLLWFFSGCLATAIAMYAISMSM